MKKDTRQEILQTAKALFNRRGYNNVTTRDIAEAMGISKGNLTYHFRKKEDIIEAIVQQMHSHYRRPPVPTTLAELDALFARVQGIARENGFYFWHYTQLAQVSGAIREIQSEMFQNQQMVFRQAFETLSRIGMLCGEEYPGQYAQLVRAVSLACIYWIPYSKVENQTGHKGDFLACVWGIIYPLLTSAGKKAYYTKLRYA